MKKLLLMLLILSELAFALYFAALTKAHQADIQAATPTTAYIYPQDFAPTPWRATVYSLCAPAIVYGEPRITAQPLYTLPVYSFVVPREWLPGWTMIQPAHYIEISALCEK